VRRLGRGRAVMRSAPHAVVATQTAASTAGTSLITAIMPSSMVASGRLFRHAVAACRKRWSGIATMKRMRTEFDPGWPDPGPEGAGADALGHRLLAQRILLLGGPLDDAASGQLIGQMLLLSSADPRSEVRLYVNSAGGSAGAFLAVYDVMQAMSAPVATICMSQAKSTAALLVAAGAAGKRFAFRHALILLKLPEERLEAGGDIEEQVEAVRRGRRSLIDVAARHTAWAREEVAVELERGVLLTPREAKKHRIIDAIVDPGHPYFVRFPLAPRPGGNGR
jgi:ATP-dependent Clp protease protease subunit